VVIDWNCLARTRKVFDPVVGRQDFWQKVWYYSAEITGQDVGPRQSPPLHCGMWLEIQPPQSFHPLEEGHLELPVEIAE